MIMDNAVLWTFLTCFYVVGIVVTPLLLCKISNKLKIDKNSLTNNELILIISVSSVAVVLFPILCITFIMLWSFVQLYELISEI